MDYWDDEVDWDDEDDWDDALLGAALHLLAEHGPTAGEDLADRLGADDEDLETIKADPLVAELAGGRLASVAALLENTVLTHRLDAEEAAGGVLRLGVDLIPALAWLCGEDHLHLAGDELVTVLGDAGDGAPGEAILEGPPGWLGAASTGDLVGIRLTLSAGEGTGGGDAGEGTGASDFSYPAASDWPGVGMPVLEVVQVPGEVAAPEAIAGQLWSSFGRLDDGDDLPVAVDDLFYQLAADAPSLVEGSLAPLSEALEGAGFEIRDGYTAPAGTDWETFGRLRHLVSVGVRHGLKAGSGHALVVISELCRLSLEGPADRLDRDTARGAASLLVEPGVAEAFAEATADDAQGTLDFLARLRVLAGRRLEATLAWVESLVAGGAGEVERAEGCLRVALAADPGHEQALTDAAWYASDRGDAVMALRYLGRLEEDPGEERTALLARYARGVAAVPSAGRNDPCPCGSGRKYKRCCLQAPAAAANPPLPERIAWLWEKLRWWLERSGRGFELYAAAVVLQGGPPDGDDLGLVVNMDLAASLVLFADGAVHQFLEQRSRLLPDDEANLVAQWALSERSLYEVVEVHPGEGMRLRDLRSGDVVAVRERGGSEAVSSGDLLLAHPVFDGVGRQLVGGIAPVSLRLRQPLMDLLDRHATSGELSLLIGSARRPPEILNTEHEPIVLCEARYRLADPAAATAQLDAVLERHNGGWTDWVETDGRRWLRGNVSLDADGGVLELSANSETRFERLRGTVITAIPALELIGEQRSPGLEEVQRRRRAGEVPLPDIGGRGRAGGPVGPGGEPPPEAAEAVAAFIREQEERWLDEQVPALAGLTPRQAAADPTRREDLVALLHELDRHPAPAGAVGFDPERLRRMLGLTGESSEGSTDG